MHIQRSISNPILMYHLKCVLLQQTIFLIFKNLGIKFQKNIVIWVQGHKCIRLLCKIKLSYFYHAIFCIHLGRVIIKNYKAELQLIHTDFTSRASLESERNAFQASISYQVNSIIRMLLRSALIFYHQKHKLEPLFPSTAEGTLNGESKVNPGVGYASNQPPNPRQIPHPPERAQM